MNNADAVAEKALKKLSKKRSKRQLSLFGLPCRDMAAILNLSGLKRVIP